MGTGIHAGILPLEVVEAEKPSSAHPSCPADKNYAQAPQRLAGRGYTRTQGALLPDCCRHHEPNGDTVGVNVWPRDITENRGLAGPGPIAPLDQRVS
jgi:hypothetical protein